MTMRSHEEQTEYIRGLESRLEEMYLWIAGNRDAVSEVLIDSASVAAHLRSYATDVLGYAHAHVALEGEAGPLDSASILARAMKEGRLIPVAAGEQGMLPDFPGCGAQAALPIACGG